MAVDQCRVTSDVVNKIYIWEFKQHYKMVHYIVNYIVGEWIFGTQQLKNFYTAVGFGSLTWFVKWCSKRAHISWNCISLCVSQFKTFTRAHNWHYQWTWQTVLMAKNMKEIWKKASSWSTLRGLYKSFWASELPNDTITWVWFLWDLFLLAEHKSTKRLEFEMPLTLYKFIAV